MAITPEAQDLRKNLKGHVDHIVSFFNEQDLRNPEVVFKTVVSELLVFAEIEITMRKILSLLKLYHPAVVSEACPHLMNSPLWGYRVFDGKLPITFEEMAKTIVYGIQPLVSPSSQSSQTGYALRSLVPALHTLRKGAKLQIYLTNNALYEVQKAPIYGGRSRGKEGYIVTAGTPDNIFILNLDAKEAAHSLMTGAMTHYGDIGLGIASIREV